MSLESTLPKPLRYLLRTEEIRAEGRREAFQFALDRQGDRSCIEAEIKWYEDWFADPADAMPGMPLTPGTSVRRHAEGHLVGLKDALTMIAQGAQMDAIQHEISRAEGRREAFQFALESNGDLQRIQSEIVSCQDELSNLKSTLQVLRRTHLRAGSPSGCGVGQDKPLASNTSVRPHAEGYLAGLQDALHSLSQAEAQQPALAKRIAEGNKDIDMSSST